MTDAADDQQRQADQPQQPTPKPTPMLVESIGGWRGLVDSGLPGGRVRRRQRGRRAAGRDLGRDRRRRRAGRASGWPAGRPCSRRSAASSASSSPRSSPTAPARPRATSCSASGPASLYAGVFLRLAAGPLAAGRADLGVRRRPRHRHGLAQGPPADAGLHAVHAALGARLPGPRPGPALPVRPGRHRLAGVRPAGDGLPVHDRGAGGLGVRRPPGAQDRAAGHHARGPPDDVVAERLRLRPEG